MNIIVNTFPFDTAKLKELSKDFPDINFEFTNTEEDLIEKIPNADALLTMKLKDEHLELAQKLEWIQGLMAGVDYLPLDTIEKRGIILTTGRGIHKNHMTEYALSMMILDARSLDQLIIKQQNKEWDPNFKQDEIKGKTLGIIGLGSIGQELARKASFMGMDVIGVKRSYSPVPHVRKIYTNDEVEEVFKNSDYIVNLLPFTPETEKFVSEKLMSIMKPTACMLNLGRGGTVDEEALYNALKNKVFRKYISDVFETEPLPKESPLWDLDNIVITPHICGPNINYMDKAYDIVKENIEKYQKDKSTMINQYSFKRGY
ncbi:MAG: D-2-hydroxyacid dehydrogenase [Bacillota bacterium]|nr:D-2-hydroxyacid dehydrogenase [Bacillota bacterium]